jgi:hypothetical protein
MVRNDKEEAKPASSEKAKPFDFTNYIGSKDKIAKKLNADVKFKSSTKDNGTIIISFSSKEQLQAILDKMV